ncbi:uncharacterized protein LOC110688789 [Chenopodium quinoa]|uniref:uncharacterized protein LOC110688789 n=1 Tax=Chenopodium quinoa TaxID=63459 RepID=UPI000B77721E|nr:uncharacterized protein LOC110688789 [Chenopodium quinoa]
MYRHHKQKSKSSQLNNNNNFSAMKMFNRFRKVFMRLMFSFPSKTGVARGSSEGFVSRRQSCDRPEPPKTSCSSSYYSPNSHYSEAIADCIEFFNKSSQEGCLNERNLDVVV